MANHSSILGPMDNVKRQKDMMLEDEPHPPCRKVSDMIWGRTEGNY